MGHHERCDDTGRAEWIELKGPMMSQSWMDGLRAEPSAVAQPSPRQVVPLRADESAPGRIDAGAGDVVSPAPGGPVQRQTTTPPAVPSGGWRALVFAASGQRINPGVGKIELRRREADAVLNASISGTHHVAVVGAKGGVGRATVAVALGHAFALYRRDRSVVLDAGCGVANRIVETRFADAGPIPTIADLLGIEDEARYPEVRACLLEANTGLQMLAAAADGRRMTDAVSEPEFMTAVDILSGHYQLLISACSAGVRVVNGAIIAGADTVLVPTTGAVQATTKALATLDWLDANQFGARPIVVLSCTTPDKKAVMGVEQTRDLFAGRVGDVVAIPYDRHLAAGGQIVWERMHRATRDAYRELAERVAAGFGHRSAGEVAW